ncbi:unnamed protein product [Paramecium pentaurelia]|uniref:Uncharacterized protein n=1 Tax=Paramecium pentaurelia TaxID=43138 RepID=A0A8S1TEA4_9CILI|nr:unnamed protein product [Paramecium pentaurelia]
MSDLISKAEYYMPNINSHLLEQRELNKNVLLDGTIKSKSQHKRQQINSTSSNQSLPLTGNQLQYYLGQGYQSKDNLSIQRSSQINKNIEQKEFQNDMININQLIQQKKKEMKIENQYFLKEISRIRQNFEMKTKIRNRIQNDRKSTTSSQDKYEKCWDQTLKEMNEDFKDFDLFVDSSQINDEEQIKRIKRPKNLRSQIFSKIREQEDQYFKECSKSIIKLMKQRSIKVVDEVTTQIEQVQLLKKEQQYQRSKEREEGKQEIIKSLRSKEQGRLLKLFQIKQSNLHQQQSKQIIEKSDVEVNSFQKNTKQRSKSLNSTLPIIDFKQDKGLIQTQIQVQNQNISKFNGKSQLNRLNLIENQNLQKQLQCS